MSLLNVSDLAFGYSVELFRDASFSIDPGDCVAVVGANGAGKSTLLALLAGDLEPSRGCMARRRGLRVVCEPRPSGSGCAATGPLFDFVFEARTELARMRPRLDDAEVVNEYQAAGGYAAEAETLRILEGLGFAPVERDLPLACLSAGQRTRAALARALHASPDLLLLDEPTNHLDIAAREWLERQIAGLTGACVIVSHDRALLRCVATRVLEIERGCISLFEGGYDEYRARRALRARQAWQEYEAYQRRKSAAEQASQRRSQLAARTATAPAGVRSGRDFYGRKAAKVARTARLLRERVAQGPEVKKPWQEQPIPALQFGRVRRSGDVALSATDLAKRYQETRLFAGVTFHMARGDRLAVIGPNGAGKTTLLRILLGAERADSGEVRFGANVQPGYFAQDAENLDPASTALEICGSDTLARTLLGCLKLRPDRVHHPCRELSAGERAKVALARLLASGANLLLLDEPTNHLEIEAQEALEQALAQFPGTIVVVSHDRSFLGALGDALKIVELGTALGQTT